MTTLCWLPWLTINPFVDDDDDDDYIKSEMKTNGKNWGFRKYRTYFDEQPIKMLG